MLSDIDICLLNNIVYALLSYDTHGKEIGLHFPENHAVSEIKKNQNYFEYILEPLVVSQPGFDSVFRINVSYLYNLYCILCSL